MRPFDLAGPLPTEQTTTVIEASAGTGKTYVLAGLVTRYIAEGRASLDQILLITFGRAASQELRDRVRQQINAVLAAFDEHSAGRAEPADALVQHLLAGTDDERAARHQRLRDAVADFDAATIATIHQFCTVALDSLGVAGDADPGTSLAEDIDTIVTETADDLFLYRFAGLPDPLPLSYKDALELAKETVANPSAALRPQAHDISSADGQRVEFAAAVRANVQARKWRQRILTYDDLLTQVAAALPTADAPAAARMHQRWPIVLVDEFQDTDPVQWHVLDRAFSGRSTLILVGDPKQAIYGFRGGDIVTYLRAADTADDKQTLARNWRSDSALVDRLQVVLQGAELGDPQIAVHEVTAERSGHRLASAPHNDPFRLRVVQRDTLGLGPDAQIPIGTLRVHIPKDLAADIAVLLASAATFEGKPIQASDVAVLVNDKKEARACQEALRKLGIPAVSSVESEVLKSAAAADWLALLEAFDQPQRSGIVRAAATTMFFGHTAADLAAGGDALTDRLADTLRRWAELARERGVAAAFEDAALNGLGDRVLSWTDGERRMTDLAQVTTLLNDVAHRERLSLAGLRDWLRRKYQNTSRTVENNLRIDSDTGAVQIVTIWKSKGRQYPIVYLPFAFNRNIRIKAPAVFHEGDERCLFAGDPKGAAWGSAKSAVEADERGEHLRLAYVALTRAQSQVVTWWAPSQDEANGPLSRLLRGRRQGDSAVPRKCIPVAKNLTDDQAWDRLLEWQRAGGPVLEKSIIAEPPPQSEPAPSPTLDRRHFDRSIDTRWRRTSYSGLIRGEIHAAGAESDAAALADEFDAEPDAPAPFGSVSNIDAAVDLSLINAGDILSPMANLPGGRQFGSLVHAVLETTDPLAPDLAAELEAQVRAHAPWWQLNVSAAVVAAALIPMFDTPLGPLAPERTLRSIGQRDRLCELDFEFPLAGGDALDRSPEIRVSDIGQSMRDHLSPEDPLAPYADRLINDAVGTQSLRGYLAGSIDAVLRIPHQDGDRYLVVDYKTNRLGDPERPLTAADYTQPRMAAEMIRSDYPLQAILYCVVLHRFLRWRQPGYDPERHLGGVLYLFVRGMCGGHTPISEGHPAGVFGWSPPARLVTDISDLLDHGTGAR